jgi:hypothetical protein
MVQRPEKQINAYYKIIPAAQAVSVARKQKVPLIERCW